MQSYEKLKKFYPEADGLEEETAVYLNEMFRMAPSFIWEHLEIRKTPKDVVFIREYETANSIYILVDGTVRAMEYRILGMQYDFMRFRAPQLFGAMEVILNMERYGTSLVTMTGCTFLVLDMELYRRWIEQDNRAMQMQFRNLLKLFFEQGRKERLLSFLQGRERLFLIFMEEYEVCRDSGGKCRIEWTQNRMAACSGLSVRTINRAVKQMSEDGFITYRRGSIQIKEEQYLKMKEYLGQIIAT